MNRLAEIFDWAGLLVRDYVLTHHDARDVEVLDVGAGQGKYRLLLTVCPKVDACEVWEPTVVAENLRSLYRSVYVQDVRALVDESWWNEDVGYDLVIMGDVLEHLTREDAQHVLARVAEVGADVVVIVPFMYPQDEEDGNVYQRHLQDDLTPELMATEYPSLRLIALETRSWRPFKGIYVGSGTCRASVGSDSED